MSDAGAVHVVSRNPGKNRAVRLTLITVALLYVAVLLIAPFAGVIWVAIKGGFETIRSTFAAADVRHAYWLTAVVTVVTVLVTTTFGMITAYVLVRDRFFGRRILNALVELPLAVSPITVGLMVILLFGRGGWFEPFFEAQGIQVIFALPSMILVTIFICLPFVIREVGPVLEELGTAEEEAARTLGASSLQTFFRVTLPNVKWGLAYGTALATARALGEIGAVLIVSGSIQGQTETATLYIFRALEERKEASGYVVALSLAAISILLLGAIEVFKHRRLKEAR
jgi:sulfate/thiosulfate transport system permease protein